MMSHIDFYAIKQTEENDKETPLLKTFISICSI